MKTLLRLLAFAAATVAAFGVQTTVLFDTDTGRLKRPFVILPADGGVPSGGQTGYVLTKVSGSDYDTTWSAAGSGSGTVTSVGLTMPNIFSVADSPVTTSGTIAVTLATQSANLVFAGPNTGSAAAPSFRVLVAADIPDLSSVYQPLDADLTALAALSSTGLAARTASGTWAVRTITGTTNRLTVTNGDGVSANPTLDIASSYVGQATITTLGTIGTGVWNGTAIANAYLANSTITIGTTSIALGATSASLAGLTSITSATASALTLATLDSNANIILDPHGTGFNSSDSDFVFTDNVAVRGWAGPNTGRGFYTQRENGSSGVHALRAGASTPAAVFDAFVCGGTLASISATPSSAQALFRIRTYTGSAWTNSGQLAITPTETHSATNQGTTIALTTTLTGSTTMVTSLQVDGSGNVVTNGTTGHVLVGTISTTGLSGSAGLKIANATDASSTTAGSVVTAGGIAVAKKGYFGDALNVVYSSITVFAGNNGTLGQLGTSSNHALGLYTNNTIYGTLSTAGALRLHAYTTAGMLVNDTSGNVTSAAINPTYTTSSPTTTYTWTASSTAPVQNLSLTFGGNVTISMSGWTNGMTGVLIVKQDATGSRTITLPANSKALSGGAGALTLTTTANAIDILTVIYDGTNYFWSKVLNFT